MAEEPDDSPIDPSPPPPAPRGKWRPRRILFYALLGLWLRVALWNLSKPLPPGMNVRGEAMETPLTDVRFLADVTKADAFGVPVYHQDIFDEALSIVGSAREWLVLDFFLFNSQRGAALDDKPHRE